MRLALPAAVRNIPIKTVIAYDISDVANEVRVIVSPLSSPPFLYSIIDQNKE